MRALLFAPGIALAAATTGPVVDVNAILTYLGLGAGGVAGWKVVNLILDKIVPSRSDKRSDVETSLNALAKTIEILSNEKAQDAKDLASAKMRVKELEDEGAADYDLIRELKRQVDEGERRVQRKDEHIATLTRELAEYGAKVVFDASGHLHVDASKSHPHAPTGSVPTV